MKQRGGTDDQHHGRWVRRWQVLGALLLAVAAGLGAVAERAGGGTEVSAQATAIDPLEATIPELQAALSAGTLTSRELVAIHLARIRAYDQQGPALNAISAINPNALAEADALDSERRKAGARGPLHGIPMIVKDNYETNDMQTGAGSILLKGWVPPGDATLVTWLRVAGAIIIAKANMHEWAWSWETYGSLFGQTRNPFAPDRVPGGSSGGTGAAIAAGFGAVGMGSDTCGSIRVPAAHNSLVGLRPTQGLASRAGIIPLSHTQDTGGPMARSVTDVAVVMDATSGYDPADPTTATSIGNVPPSYLAFLERDGLRGARIGVLTNLFGSEPDDEEVATIVRGAAEEMRAAGAEVVEVTIPDLTALVASAYSGVIRDEFKFDIDNYLQSRPTAPVQSLEEIVASGQFAPGVEMILRTTLGIEIDTKEYYTKLARRAEVQLAALNALAEQRLDALLYPTVRRKAVRIGEGSQMGVNCNLSAQSGLPAISVPAGFTPDGLPVGVELLGRAWSEGTLIRLAFAYEQATHHRRPPASTPPLASSDR